MAWLSQSGLVTNKRVNFRVRIGPEDLQTPNLSILSGKDPRCEDFLFGREGLLLFPRLRRNGVLQHSQGIKSGVRAILRVYKAPPEFA